MYYVLSNHIIGVRSIHLECCQKFGSFKPIFAKRYNAN